MKRGLVETERTAAEEIGIILDVPPSIAEETLRGDTRLTQRWCHGGLNDYLPAMNSHVIMTYYAKDQDISLKVDGKRISSKTKQGTITLIPAGHDGQWNIAGDIEVSHVYLTPERLQSCADHLVGGRSYELLDRVGFDDLTTSRILEMLSREAALIDSSSRLFAEQAIDLLCTQLIRSHSSFNALPDPEVKRGLATWQVKKVTDYMREHLTEDIGLDELAATINLSRFHFCTSFRQATGKTPYEWLMHERITFARKLLADPLFISVTDVGLAVGYETPSAFAACFRKIVGMTPTQYRRNL